MARSLRVEIIGDASGLAKALGSAAGATESFGAKMNSVGKSMASVGRTMTHNVTLPIVALAAASTKMAVTFEDSMQQLRTSAGASQKEVNNMSKAVLALSQTAKGGGQGPEALAKALYMVESSGIRGGAALKVLSAAAVNARVTGADMTSVVDALTSAVKVNAIGTGTASHAMGVLNAVVGAGKMRMADLTTAMQSGILPVAKQLGISLPQVGAALDVFTIAGVPAEQAATKLKTAFLKMLAPTGAGAKSLQVMGIASTDLAVTLSKGGLTGALELVSTHYDAYKKKLEETMPPMKAAAMANAALVNSFGGSRTGATILTLVQQFDQYKKSLDQVNKTTTDYATNASKALDLPASKIHEAVSSIQASLIQVGVTLAPVIQRIAAFVARLGQEFDNLSPKTKNLILIGAGIAAALGPVVSIVGNATRAIGGLGTALGAVATGSPMAVGLVALGVAAAALGAHFYFAQQAAANLKAAFDAVKNSADALTATFSSLSDSNLRVAEAKAQVAATSHQVEAALRAEAQASDGSAKSTLQEKIAHDAVVSAKLAHQTATNELSHALEGQTAAQKTATAAMRESLQPVLSFADNLGKATGWSGLLGGKLPGVASALNTLTGGFIGFSGATRVSEAQARTWGMAVEMAGRQVFTAAVNTTHMAPAARAAHEAIGLMTEAAGRFAREAGHVPTSIAQITKEAARLHPEQFAAVMNAWIASARKAGVDVPAWARRAVAGVSAEKGPAGAAGSAVGSAIGLGLVGGVRAYAQTLANVAVQIVLNAIAAARAAIGASSPAKATIALGKDFVDGLVQGIIQNEGKATGAAAQTAQKAVAAMQAKELVAMVNQYGKTIGLAQAKGIVEGLVAGTPSVVAQARTQMQEAQKTMREQILTGAGQVGDAFGQMADRALAAFDAKVAAWKNPLTAKLTAMQNVDAAKQGAAGLAGAMEAVLGGNAAQTQSLADSIGKTISEALARGMGLIDHAKTQQALTTAAGQAQTQMTAAINAAAQPAIDAANNQVAIAQANLDAAIASGDQEAITKATTDLNTAVTNQQTLYAAVRGEIERQTGVLAGEVDKQHATIAAHDRTGLANDLKIRGEYLAKHPALWDKMGAEVQKTLAKYDVKFQAAGKTWAQKFADGIRSGKSFVTSAVQDLVNAALAQIHQSPPKEGPLAGGTVDRAGKLLAMEYAGGIASASGIVSSAMRAMVGGGISGGLAGGSMAIAGTGSGSSGGGGMTVNVTVQGALLGSTTAEVAETIRRELYRTKSRNGSLDF